MRKLPLLLNLICLPVLADVTAYLDRRTITVQDTVRLTLEADDRVQQPVDVSPLYHDFQFLGSKQLTLSSHASGDSRYRTRWEILLRPKSAGELDVPALHIGTESSQALKLKVLNSGASQSGLQGEQAYIESELDAQEVYLGSQLLYTVRLYHAMALSPGAKLTAPYVPGSQIKPWAINGITVDWSETGNTASSSSVTPSSRPAPARSDSTAPSSKAAPPPTTDVSSCRQAPGTSMSSSRPTRARGATGCRPPLFR
ncbi:BatD family protein [Marinobacterium aestuariivivens]|uniref:BatD family protein n=1 Tax=Marinobacterium aestuariivivens TaxID=1698799 RepID=A0ABW1ZU57_9GAMM